MKSVVGIVAIALCVACSGSGSPASGPSAQPPQTTTPPVPPPTVPPARLPDSPWSAAPVSWSSVPRAYRTAWEAAENRATCAPIAPAAAISAEAAPRTAYFSGGWAVAYDLPEQRSAYGVAGTGASATGDTYQGFPNRIDWSDGSLAMYGPEGGSGPNQLAYVTIPGQSCLYNVWSRVSVAHLEQLLASLRFVR
jgi:hypothetical protein